MNIITIYITMIIAVLFLVIGTMSYKDSLAEAEKYRDMVCDGTWPDYKDINPDCGGEE